MATVSTRKPYPRKRLADMTPAEQLAEQIKRVEKQGLRVVGHGTFKADGTPFYLVPSVSEKLRNMHHVVKKTARGLECDCYACTESHPVCLHRAATFLYLKSQAEASKPAQPAQPAQTMAQRAAATLPYSEPEKEFSIYR